MLSAIMRWAILFNGLLVTTVVTFAASKVSADLVLPKEIQEDVARLMPKGDFRQGMQLGITNGLFSSFCLMAEEGVTLPGEGPMTTRFLNELSSKMISKLGLENNNYLFEYQRLGLNMAIAACNQSLGAKLDYR